MPGDPGEDGDEEDYDEEEDDAGKNGVMVAVIVNVGGHSARRQVRAPGWSWFVGFMRSG